VPKGPSLDAHDKRMAVEVEDHPFDYASFEGVIPAKQYGAGRVIVWDCGVYSPDEGQRYDFDDRGRAEERMRAELAAGKVSFFLCGSKLKGSFTLVRTKATNQWLLMKHRDRFAQPNDVLARSRSVLSQQTVDALTAATVPARLEAGRLAPAGLPEKFPAQLEPMLAETGSTIRFDPGWSFEPKLDGYRVIALVASGEVRLQSRRGLDLTACFPEIAAELRAQPGGQMILDGEIVALTPEGRPSFNALQNRAQLRGAAEIESAQRQTPVVLLCFDLLHSPESTCAARPTPNDAAISPSA
jgi:bifunctional non-homologous end joining protein LigD